MIKKLIKLKILKFTLVGGLLLAYIVKKYCDKKKIIKKGKTKHLYLLHDIKILFYLY